MTFPLPAFRNFYQPPLFPQNIFKTPQNPLPPTVVYIMSAALFARVCFSKVSKLREYVWRVQFELFANNTRANKFQIEREKSYHGLPLKNTVGPPLTTFFLLFFQISNSKWGPLDSVFVSRKFPFFPNYSMIFSAATVL